MQSDCEGTDSAAGAEDQDRGPLLGGGVPGHPAAGEGDRVPHQVGIASNPFWDFGKASKLFIDEGLRVLTRLGRLSSDR